jgi:succinoglycan biosynthesis transport protein ExoP
MSKAHHSERSTARHFLHVLIRRRWLVLQAVIVVPVAAIAFSVIRQHVYQAQAEVLLSPALVTTVFNTGDPGGSLAAFVAKTEAGVARATPVAQAAVKRSGLPDLTAGQLLGASIVTLKPNADVMVFKVRDPDPQRAKRLATAYAEGYIAYRRDLEGLALGQAHRELSARLAQLAAQGRAQSVLYTTLSERAAQLSTLQALDDSGAVLVRKAVGVEQIQPRTLHAALVGLAIGLLLGLGLAVLRESLDVRVRSAEEVAERLGLTILGRLPKPPRSLRVNSELLMNEAADTAKAEAYRVLRANLHFANNERRAKTIMITSAGPSEGKTTTAANLSVALAQAGHRVALVDLDLRRPSLGHFFLLLGPGLTNVALGKARLEHAITRRKFGPEGVLEILGSGPLPPNPSEFIDSGAVEKILARLAARVDIVIIDSPPLLGLNDGLILSSKVDGLVVISRLNAVNRPMLTELRRVLDGCPAAELGLIVTGTEADTDFSYEGLYRYEQEPADTRRLRVRLGRA